MQLDAQNSTHAAGFSVLVIDTTASLSNATVMEIKTFAASLAGAIKQIDANTS